MKFSIIIVTYNNKKELLECLGTLVGQSIAYNYEVIVVFNGETSYLEKARQLFPQFRHLLIKQTTTAAARNFAVTQAEGEYLFFLDDDCLVPKDYFKLPNFDQDWDVLGGPDQTPLQANLLQLAIGHALASPFCMGPTYRRHSQISSYLFNANEDSLISRNVWFKKKLFKDEGYHFNDNLLKNEENFLLKELKSHQKILHYNPKLFIYHHRKDSIEKLGAAIIKSGECRVQNIALLPLKNEIIYFAPLAFLILLLFTIFSPHLFFTSILLSYLSVIVCYSLYRYKKFYPSYILLHFFILICYAIGLIRGSLRVINYFYASFKDNKPLLKEFKK